MKNILCGLAALGLVASAPALAQSSVAIFGTVDMGYRWSGDNIDPAVKNRNGIDSGTSVPTRLGFRGVEDLGGGWKAGFVLEQAIAADTGQNIGGALFSRQSLVSLSGPFGALALGRQYVPGYLLTSEIDPFGSVTVGQYNNVYLSEYRWDNTVSYVSPSTAGFTLAASYARNGYGNETASGPDVRALGLVPQYRSGPLLVGLNVQELKRRAAGSQPEGTVRVYDLGGAYQLGAFRLAALYGRRQSGGGDVSPDTGAVDARRSRQWLLGVTAQVGAAGTVRASYVARHSDALGATGQARASQWAVGYEHALSKRTAVYAVYADVSNNAAAKASTGLAAAVGAGYNPGAGFQKGFGTGIRHDF